MSVGNRFARRIAHVATLIFVCVNLTIGVQAGGGSALDFDGTDDYVSTSTASALNMGGSSYTIELWVWGDSGLSYSGIAQRLGFWCRQ